MYNVWTTISLRPPCRAWLANHELGLLLLLIVQILKKVSDNVASLLAFFNVFTKFVHTHEKGKVISYIVTRIKLLIFLAVFQFANNNLYWKG